MERKRDALRVREAQERDERDQEERTVYEKPVDLKHARIGEYDVGHGIARPLGGIDPGIKVDDDARSEEHNREQGRDAELLLSCVVPIPPQKLEVRPRMAEERI